MPSEKSTDGSEDGKQWFAGVLWEEMPEDAKQQLTERGDDE